MSLTILFGWKPGLAQVKALEQLGEKYDKKLNIISYDGTGDLPPQLTEAEIYVSWARKDDTNLILNAPKLKWVQLLTSGVENFIDIAQKRNISLTNVKGINKHTMADHIMALLLFVERRIFYIYRNQQKKLWRTLPAHDLYQKKVVIWGLGDVGKELAKRLKAFGVQVIGIKKNLVISEYVDKLYCAEEWQEAVKNADVLISLLPGGTETNQILNRGVFELLPSHAIFMNFGRGSVVNTDDLVNALEQRQLGSAVLDVFDQEPLSADSNLWTVNNLYISPHMAAMSPDYMERAMNLFIENMELYLCQKKLKNLIDFQKGY